MNKISANLRNEIQEKGYELPTGKVRFPKKLREKYRKEVADYRSDSIKIIQQMINIYQRYEE